MRHMDYYHLDRDFEIEKEEWIFKMKKLMPPRFKYEALPMFFNFANPERIRSMLVEKKAEFLNV